MWADGPMTSRRQLSSAIFKNAARRCAAKKLRDGTSFRVRRPDAVSDFRDVNPASARGGNAIVRALHVADDFRDGRDCVVLLLKILGKVSRRWPSGNINACLVTVPADVRP